MNFESMLKRYSDSLSNMTETEFYEKLDKFIESIQTVTDIAKELRDIAIDVLTEMKRSVKLNLSPRNITKEKLQKALSVFEKTADLEANNNEEQKQFIKILAEMTRQLIEINPSIRRR